MLAVSDENRFDALMKAGRVAFIRGQRRKAHHYWREAATLEPHTEDVWEKLLSVVETDADRRTCLENMLAINPKNDWAARQLAALNAHRDGTAPGRPAYTGRLRRFAGGVFVVVKYGVLGIALGLAISAFIQRTGIGF